MGHARPRLERKHLRHFRTLTAGIAALGLLLAACGTDEVGDEQATAGAAPDGDAQEESEDAGSEVESDDSTEAGDTPYYEGATIEVIVPFSAGGGTDLTGRFFADALSRHIEGNPTVQVVNIEGGGSLIGANQFAHTEPDGFTLFQGGAGTNLAYVMGYDEVEFDYANWKPLASVPFGYVVIADQSTGIDSPEKIANPDNELIYGAIDVAQSSLTRVLAFSLLDVPFRVVSGFEGSSAIQLAFEQGEVTAYNAATTRWREEVADQVDAGEVYPIYTLGQDFGEGIERDPAFPDVPTVRELYEMIHGTEMPDSEGLRALDMLSSAATTFSKTLWMHADAPPEARAAIDAAMESLQDDPEVLAGIDELFEGYEPIFGDQLGAAIQDLMTPDESAIEWLYGFIEDYE